MTIFTIRRGAGSKFRLMRFVNESDGLYSKWEHLARPDPVASIWIPPKLRFYEPGETHIPGDSKKRPLSTATDMPYVYGHGLLVVSARLIEQCGGVLRRFGELLPIDCGEGEFFAYHCTNIVDCLDEQASRVSRSRTDGRILNVYDPVFRAERLTPMTVFRIPVGNREVVYCDDQVHAMLMAPPLQGVTADPVWSSHIQSTGVAEPTQSTPLGHLPKRGNQPLNTKAKAAVAESLELAKSRLGIDTVGISFAEIHDRIAAKLSASAGCGRTMGEAGAIAAALGAVWGETICREFAWQWALVDGAAAVVSPTFSHVVFPMTWFHRQIASSQHKPRSLDLYEAIRDAKLPRALPNTFLVVGE